MEFINAPVGGQRTPIKVLSKHYKARRRRRIVTGTLAALALGSIAIAYALVRNPAPPRVVADASADSPDAGRVVRAESPAAPVRPVYRHSVVPGGVRSPEEIEYVIQRDHVVAAHYKGINPQLMRNERLKTPLRAHVSYRLGDKVYWTKKPVQLPVNEPVMTDGKTTIRERCGNLISMEPLAPASDEEPPLPSFDLLMDPMQFAWMRLDYTPPGIPAKPTPRPAARLLVPGPIGGPLLPGTRKAEEPPSTRSVDPPPGSVTPVDPPLPVPEPNTLTMFGLAGAAGVAHYLRKRARARVRN